MDPLCLRSLPSCSLPGPLQMAIDAWLLERVIAGERRGPLLRLYRWSQPTLSLGRHQQAIPPHWLRLASEGRLALVRRPSGGSAVLHGGDLTYALIWGDPPRRRREAYHLSCGWLQEAFAAMGWPLEFGDSPCRHHEANCFATSTAADLVHPGGQKRIGSAQRWRGHALLQHGSIALRPDEALWEAVFESPAPRLPELPLAEQDLEALLLQSASRWWWRCSSHMEHQQGESAVLLCEPLQAWEWSAVQSSQKDYEVLGLAGKSADSAMALATGSRASPRG